MAYPITGDEFHMFLGFTRRTAHKNAHCKNYMLNNVLGFYKVS